MRRVTCWGSPSARGRVVGAVAASTAAMLFVAAPGWVAPAHATAGPASSSLTVGELSRQTVNNAGLAQLRSAQAAMQRAERHYAGCAQTWRRIAALPDGPSAATTRERLVQRATELWERGSVEYDRAGVLAAEAKRLHAAAEARILQAGRVPVDGPAWSKALVRFEGLRARVNAIVKTLP